MTWKNSRPWSTTPLACRDWCWGYHRLGSMPGVQKSTRNGRQPKHRFTRSPRMTVEGCERTKRKIKLTAIASARWHVVGDKQIFAVVNERCPTTKLQRIVTFIAHRPGQARSKFSVRWRRLGNCRFNRRTPAELYRTPSLSNTSCRHLLWQCSTQYDPTCRNGTQDTCMDGHTHKHTHIHTLPNVDTRQAAARCCRRLKRTPQS